MGFFYVIMVDTHPYVYYIHDIEMREKKGELIMSKFSVAVAFETTGTTSTFELFAVNAEAAAAAALELFLLAGYAFVLAVAEVTAE